MDQLIARCAGLDVHKKTVAACVRLPGNGRRRRKETRTFTTTTRGLLQLRDWLAELGVTVVGMESTSSYWKPVFYVLEDDFEVWLLNARHVHWSGTNEPAKEGDHEHRDTGHHPPPALPDRRHHGARSHCSSLLKSLLTGTPISPPRRSQSVAGGDALGAVTVPRR